MLRSLDRGPARCVSEMQTAIGVSKKESGVNLFLKINVGPRKKKRAQPFQDTVLIPQLDFISEVLAMIVDLEAQRRGARFTSLLLRKRPRSKSLKRGTPMKSKIEMIDGYKGRLGVYLSMESALKYETEDLLKKIKLIKVDSSCEKSIKSIDVYDLPDSEPDVVYYQLEEIKLARLS
jgi:hypothetical protein